MKSIPAAAFAIGLFVFGALAMPFITPLSFLTAEIYEAVGVGIKRDSAISQAAPTAVLLSWNTFGNAGTETTEPSVSNDPNLSPSTLTLGAGVTPAINANRFGGVNWWDTGDSSTTTLAQSVSGNDYIEFIVTPNPGFSFTPTSFVFIWDRSSTGPQNVALRSSADGYTTNLGTVSAILTGAFETNTINISGLTNLTSATTFRLYGYGGTAAGGTGGLDTPNSLTATATLNGSTAAAPVPAIQVTGGPLSFGNQAVNTTSGQLSLTVTNTGSGNLVLGTPTFASGTQFEFTSDPNGTVIAPTDSALVSFTFTPTSTGAKNDTVTIASNAAGSAPTVTLTGTGVSPEIEITPMAIDFGEQTEGLPTGLQSVTIRNTGTGDLALGTLVKSGTNDADFTIVDDPSGAVISSGESRQLRFRFTPAAQGNRTAQILIPNNDADESSAIVELSGFGVAPAAAAPTKGMWVFGGSIVPNPVSDPTGRATLINRSYANDVDTLYVSVYQSTTDPMSGRRMYADEDMAAVIGAAHANGQQVWAAYGDTGWHNFGCSSTDFPVQRMAEIAAYNASRPANERFDGVMLDVEPDPDPSTPGEFQALLSHYECMRNSLPASIKLGAAIRFFWDDDNVTYPEVGGVVKPAAHHIIDLDLDSVIVMGYRDTAGVSGGNGIIGLDENEVSYATAIGRPGLVLAGVETISGQPDNVTFFEEGQVAMNAEIALVASHFWSSSGFGGFAIHNYQGSYLSGLSGWPVGPTAAPASISGRVTTSRGAGISGVTITVQDLNGVSRTTVTSTFGHYRIAGLDAGEAYIVTASSRKYTFAAGSQLVNLDDNVDGVNFVATR